MDTNLQNLLYRFQFFFGKSTLPLDNWVVTPMPDGFALNTHPELSVTRVEANGFSVTLLGFILDPDRPADSDEEILKRLCASTSSIEDFIEATEPLGGRWLIFLYHGDSGIVFNDAAGLRTAYYHVDAHGNPGWGLSPGCSS